MFFIEYFLIKFQPDFSLVFVKTKIISFYFFPIGGIGRQDSWNPMLHLLYFFSMAQANWGPFPVEQEKYDVVELPNKTVSCSSSRLINGLQMPDSKHYRIVDKENVWGTTNMINALTIATEELSWLVPNADPLVIGDISKQGGGHMKGHRSHRGGSDADVGIYRGVAEQSPYGLQKVHPSDFDAKTNWLLIRALFDTGKVERILSDQKLINKLHEYVIKSGELSKKEADRMFPRKMKKTIWLRNKVVQHHSGHKHHFHIRTHCGHQSP